MTKSTNGHNGITPAYEDKLPVANKITFFARTDREYTVLMQPFVGEEGMDKDIAIIEFAERLDSLEGTEMGKLKILAKDPEFKKIVAMALGMDNEEDWAWLNQNFNLMSWFDAFKAAVDYRMAGSVWRKDVQEALGK